MVENGEIICVYSDLTLTELENAPEAFQKFIHCQYGKN